MNMCYLLYNNSEQESVQWKPQEIIQFHSIHINSFIMWPHNKYIFKIMKVKHTSPTKSQIKKQTNIKLSNDELIFLYKEVIEDI